MTAEPYKNVSPPQEQVRQVHTSVLLRQLVDSVKDDHFTLGWLVGHLPRHSFGVIMLFLGLISMIPLISMIAQILISLLAIQIIMGYHTPVLPRRLMERKLPSRYLFRLNHFAIPALEKLERVVRPRWYGILIAMRRPTAFIALLLTVMSFLAPLPMVNVPPAAISVLMALAYIEHDGLLLCMALLLAMGLVALVTVAIW